MIDGGTLLRANQQADTDAADRPSPDKGRVVHGAIMLYNSQADQRISGVTVRNITITGTHPQGYDHVRVASYSGQVQGAWSSAASTSRAGATTCSNRLGCNWGVSDDRVDA